MSRESGVDGRDLLEALLELAAAAELEVRILSRAASGADLALSESAACRVGSRIWVVLSPGDPVDHQAEILAGALARYRSEFLESRFIAPAIREFIERVDPS